MDCSFSAENFEVREKIRLVRVEKYATMTNCETSHRHGGRAVAEMIRRAEQLWRAAYRTRSQGDCKGAFGFAMRSRGIDNVSSSEGSLPEDQAHMIKFYFEHNSAKKLRNQRTWYLPAKCMRIYSNVNDDKVVW
jgi:hypothetical protein